MGLRAAPAELVATARSGLGESDRTWPGVGRAGGPTLSGMDEDRLRFLFGRRVAGGEPTTEGERATLLGADRRDIDYDELPLYTAIANQILDGQPPQTWQTACRLLDSGSPDLLRAILYLQPAPQTPS
ncbi:MAG: hypothetical protein ACRDRH_10200 [Pseudonocardia sp.]